MFCKHCGKEIPDDSTYCPKCGTKIAGEEPPAPKPGERYIEPPKLDKKPPAENKEDSNPLPKIIGFIAVGIAIFIFMAAGSQPSKSPAPAKPAVTTSTTKTETPAPKKEAVAPPVTLDHINVEPNMIGENTVHLSIRNDSQKTIDAYKVRIYVKDNYDKTVKGFSTEDYFSGISQDTIEPGSYGPAGKVWTLHGYDNGRKFTLRLMSIHFTDGSTWETADDQNIIVEGKR